jgi:hypothetical protein
VGSEHFDETGEQSISNAGGVTRSQLVVVNDTLEANEFELDFGTAFGYGSNVTFELYESGILTSGSEGASDCNDLFSFWYTGGKTWINPNPALGVSLDKVIANVNVNGMPGNFQGDITIARTLEMVNGDKKTFGLTFDYFGDNNWGYHGSATRKIGNLTLNAHAKGNQSSSDEYGMGMTYFAGSTHI